MPDVLAGYNGADGIPEGTTPTSGNSGGDSGNAVGTIAVGSGTIIATSASAHNGARGYQFVLPANTGGAQRLIWGASSAVGTRRVYGFWLRIATAISSTEDIFHTRVSAGNGTPQLTFTAAGFMAWNGLAGSVGTVAFPVNSWQWVQLAVKPNTTTTTGELAWGWGPSATSLTDSWSSTVTNAGTSALTGLAIGRTTTRIVGNTIDFDGLRWGDLTSGFLTTPQTDPVAAATMASTSSLSADGAGPLVAAATMASGSTLTSAATVDAAVATTMTSASSLTATITASRPAAVTFASQSGMSSNGIRASGVAVAMASTSTTSTDATRAAPAAVAMVSASSFGSDGDHTVPAAIVQESTSAMSAAATFLSGAAATFTSGSSLTADAQLLATLTAAVGMVSQSGMGGPSPFPEEFSDGFGDGFAPTAVKQAAVVMASTSTMATGTGQFRASQVFMSSVSSLTANGIRVRSVAVTMNSTSATVASGITRRPATATLTSTSSMSASTTVRRTASVRFGSQSNLSVDATLTTTGHNITIRVEVALVPPKVRVQQRNLQAGMRWNHSYRVRATIDGS